MDFKELLKDLDAIQIIEFKSFLKENIKEIMHSKNNNAKIILNQNGKPICPKCSRNLWKNGHDKRGVQQYICCDCHETITETTNTVTYHSKLNFEIWKESIDNLIDGLSVRRMATRLNINKNTSFLLRHKLINALSLFVEEIKLRGEIEADEKYIKINLKGTKPSKMPRLSKTHSSSSLRGISHHKVCIASAIDENDNILLKVAGLGPASTNMLDTVFKNKILNNSEFITDSKSSYIQFCQNNNLKLTQIPSGSHQSKNLKNLANINNLHSQLSGWLVKFKGVSNKHLQEYLNWFSYIFMMKRKFENNQLEINLYKNIIPNHSFIKLLDIFSKAFPIDLKMAYGEYHYGIFAT